MSHVCSYMIRSAWTIFREPMRSLAKVTIFLELVSKNTSLYVQQCCDKKFFKLCCVLCAVQCVTHLTFYMFNKRVRLLVKRILMLSKCTVQQLKKVKKLFAHQNIHKYAKMPICRKTYNLHWTRGYRYVSNADRCLTASKARIDPIRGQRKGLLWNDSISKSI